MGVMALFEAAGAFGVKAFPWARGEWSMPVMSLLLALCLGVIPGVGPAGVVAALAVFGLVTGISGPIQKQRMNEAILDSRYRATLLSVESILDRAVCAGVASVLGGYLTRNELFFFLGLASWTTAALVLLLQWGMGSQRAKP
jgi:hypothetical protein